MTGASGDGVATDLTALLVLDQKGEPEDVEHMKQLAARAAVPFVLFDSQDPATNRAPVNDESHVPDPPHL